MLDMFFEGMLSLGKSCIGTICGRTTTEPISDEVRNQRESASCTLDNEAVEAISPLSSSNPKHVKNVEAIIPESKFNEFFPKRNDAYTYTNFLKAIGKYPSICSEATSCPRILANMLAHIQVETWGCTTWRRSTGVHTAQSPHPGSRRLTPVPRVRCIMEEELSN